MSNEISEQEYREFVANGSSRYIQAFKKISAVSIFSFNYEIIFLSFVWPLWRRMYLLFWATTFFFVIENLILKYFFPKVNLGKVNLIEIVIYSIFLLFFSDLLYFKHATKSINKLKTLNLKEDDYHQKLKRIGGTDIVSASMILMLIIVVTLATIVKS